LSAQVADISLNFIEAHQRAWWQRSTWAANGRTALSGTGGNVGARFLFALSAFLMNNEGGLK
jgi:hypothetical protein